jgi:uncharacterized protein GlcG (DUF336 family)
MMEAAGVKARLIGKPVSIAIVDASGCLVLFERFDGAAANTAIVAEGKAAASALTGKNSSELSRMTSNHSTGVLEGQLGRRFVFAQGAVVIRDDELIVGAIGASGASGEEDEQIAEAGAAAY